MARIREIPRTATFAWSPVTASSLIATGTRAGAVDADFSNDTQLEIWDLADFDAKDSHETQPVASVETDSRSVLLKMDGRSPCNDGINLGPRFHDIAWAHPNSDHPQGLIAGALENGSLDLWSGEKLSQGKGTSKHSGPIKALQFNPSRHGILATAGAKGELFISDLNNIDNPYRMGNSVARADDFDCLDWNKNVPHIAVTGSSGGFVTVWDVKTKKESLTLNNMGRKAVSAVAWDPNKPTRLVTAIPYDTDPLIAVWDLRNTNAPERVLRGHDGGVLSLSWCAQDNDLLISCGKDNRTICWNPQTGEAYGEYPVVTNWTFQTRWNPHNPSLLATASFDGKITMHPIQSTHSDARLSSGAPSQSVDDADFFNKAQSTPQGSSFSLPKAPKWLRRPCGVSFGFGGKLISFNVAESEVHTGSKIRISTFAIDAGIGESSSEFEKAVQDRDLSGICKKQISRKLDDSEEADWRVIEALTSQDPRKELIQHLGFSASIDEAADGISKLPVNGDTVDDASATKGNGVPTSRQNRLSAFFENSGEGDSFLSDLAATKGAKINNPFQIYSGSESEPDRRITRALLMGQFDKALDVCLEEDRLSDAFMVAICGGQSCIEKAQKAYFNRKTGGPNYLRVLASVVGKNLWDIVYNAGLDNWKEVMAALCTYATVEDFPDLCEALGDRLEEQVKTGENADTTHQDASFCYLAGSKLEKVVGIWISGLEQRERSESQNTSNDSTFGIHTRLLQQFVEKVTVFREATKFDDKELQATSNWKLGLLYDKYTEYADLVASYGQLGIAKRYLELLPKKYPAAEAAKERINQATQRPTAPTASKQPPATARTSQRNAGPVGLERQANNIRPVPNPSNLFAPTSAYQTQPNPQSTPAPYKPPGYSDGPSYQQPRQPSVPPLQGQGPYQNPSLAPPPRTFNPSPSVPPPSKASNMGNWNDMPESFIKPPTARRGTPSAPPSSINQPYGYPPAAAAPGMAQSPSGGPQQPASSLPPPPKGMPRTNSPMNPMVNPASMQNPPNRPSSSVANTYAPPPQASYQSTPVQQVPRGQSPYNPPPSAAPSSNRYAPAPHSPKEAYAVPRTGPPPPNPYAPQQGYSQGQARGPNESTNNQAMPPITSPPRNLSGPPPMNGPPPNSSGPPPTTFGNARAEAVPTQGGEAANVTATRKHGKLSQALSRRSITYEMYSDVDTAPGDRSHIPSKSRPIFELLNTDMQRVKTRAPANFQKQVNDTEKRLNILFDHLNNEDLLKDDTVDSMVELSQALQARDYEQAQNIHLELLTNKTDQCGQWMVGVKRLIAMSRATP
ncbi:MAG: hypothetical protein Q9226_000186 [Calogaya cf. arnoldii]